MELILPIIILNSIESSFTEHNNLQFQILLATMLTALSLTFEILEFILILSKYDIFSSPINDNYFDNQGEKHQMPRNHIKNIYC